jgi:4-hydroxybenzoate polyprenyltransferase
VITRLGRYVAGSFPPVFYVPYALSWSLGASALFVLGDPRQQRWRPGGGTVVTVLGFVLVLLLMRAIDDIRDLDYDRSHNPHRPLAAGAVRTSDLMTMIIACAIVVIALNAGRGNVVVAAAVPLVYAIVLLGVDLRWHWPPGDNLALNGLVGLPVQILLNLYLYAGVLHDSGLAASRYAVLPVLTAIATFLHLEYARKLTREPASGERSYVTVYGVNGTAAGALIGAAVSAGLGLALTQPWSSDQGAAPWGYLLLAPLVFPVYGAYRFWHSRTTRWPVAAAALFLICSFLAYLIIAVLGKDAR